jgi:hypothetical protein
VQETSAIEIISMELGAAFEVKEVGKIVRDKTATIKKIRRVRIRRAHPS